MTSPSLFDEACSACRSMLCDSEWEYSAAMGLYLEPDVMASRPERALEAVTGSVAFWRTVSKGLLTDEMDARPEQAHRMRRRLRLAENARVAILTWLAGGARR